MASQVLRLNHPYLAPGSAKANIQYPKQATVEAQALFQIFSHATRLQDGQHRVIGTLLGSRSEDGSEVEIKCAYMIPISESGDEVTIDVDYYSEMFSLLKKSFPDLLIVGWYSTSPELNSVSGLIHDLFSKENGTFPHPPVHLTIDPESVGIDIECYVSLPLWASQENHTDGNCLFTPIQTTVKFEESDQPLLALTEEKGGANVYGLPHSTDDAIEQTLKQIDFVLQKVEEAKSSGSKEAETLGRYLYRVVSSAPVLEAPSTAVPHKVQQQGGKYDPRSAMYNAYMRDLMSIVNLTSSIRWQVQLTSEVSSNLA